MLHLGRPTSMPPTNIVCLLTLRDVMLSAEIWRFGYYVWFNSKYQENQPIAS